MKASTSLHFVWFTAGLTLGFALVTLSSASLPTRIKPAESKGPTEVSTKGLPEPTLSTGYHSLSASERNYAENWEQQKKIRSAALGTRVRQPVLALQKKSQPQMIQKRVVKEEIEAAPITEANEDLFDSAVAQEEKTKTAKGDRQVMTRSSQEGPVQKQVRIKKSNSVVRPSGRPQKLLNESDIPIINGRE